VGSRWFVAERVGEATVLTFTQADLLDQETVLGIREGVLDLLEGGDHRRLVLDFSGVRTLSSTMLGLLIGLTKRAQQAGGDLTLCSLAPDLHDKFQTTRLHQFFRICPDRQAALPVA
jgi:stage II sporulation protein AA (anti-sigma F factor antagonist)